MKAHFKAFFLYYLKSGYWFLYLIMAGAIVAFSNVTGLPGFCALIVFWFLTPVSDWQRVRKKSGMNIYEFFSARDVKDGIGALYLCGLLTCIICTFILRMGMPWIAQAVKLFPALPLISAACDLPWHYLNDDRKTAILVRAVTLILTFFLYAQLREMPLVIPAFPLWLLILINLLIVSAYYGSYRLAVYFAKKRGEAL